MQMSLLAVTHLCYAQTPEPSMAPQHLQNQVKIPLKTPSDSSLHPPPFPVLVLAHSVPSTDNTFPCLLTAESF